MFLQESLWVCDSCSNINMVDTPTSNSGVKRSSNNVDSIDVIVFEIGEASATKTRKLVRVKVEPINGKRGLNFHFKLGFFVNFLIKLLIWVLSVRFYSLVYFIIFVLP